MANNITQLKIGSNTYDINDIRIITLEDNSTSTAGTWLAKTSQISAYADGQIFIYKTTKAGASTTTLNITGSAGTALGAKNVYRSGSTKVTTQYAANTYLLLVYNSSLNSGCFMVLNDYDANTNASHSGIGICPTAASTAAKVVTFPNFALATNQTILLRVNTTNSATSGVTLNVNSTGAKSVKIGGSAWSTSNQLNAGDYIATYDGTYWNLTRVYLTDTNTDTHRSWRINGEVASALSGTKSDVNLKAGTNVSITASGADITIAATDTTYSAASTSAAGLMSAADKTKLDGIATGATKVTTDTVSGWGYTKNTGTVTSVSVGTTSYTPSSGVVALPDFAALQHEHGNIDNGGYLSTASRIVVTDSSKKITVGSIDPANLVVTSDSRLSDSRTPKSHTHGNIANDGTITSTAVTSATGVLVYDSSNKIQRATAAQTRAIIGAGTSSLTLGTTSTTAAKGDHNHNSTYLSLSGGTLTNSNSSDPVLTITNGSYQPKLTFSASGGGHNPTISLAPYATGSTSGSFTVYLPAANGTLALTSDIKSLVSNTTSTDGIKYITEVSFTNGVLTLESKYLHLN